MLVTDIVKLDKKKSKIIFCDGSIIALYSSEIRKFDISVDSELDDDVLALIKKDILFKRGKERALYILKSSSKTKHQIISKLKDGYYPEDVIERIVAFLNEYSFIDDYEYATRYYNTYSGSKSIRAISMDLVKKGVDKSIISEIVDSVDVDRETEQIMKLLEKKHYTEHIDDYKEKNRIISYLLRRGYEYDKISSCLNYFKS
ncbi:MAG: regulatory protein RecX [Clostridiales bacterium]|nr:regulatory protein RecX [Clostridiales bacterium]